MDIKLRQIVNKAAGTYFIVSDNSQVETIEGESRLRLIPGSFEQGPVNIVVKFAKGDKAGFTSIFGTATRSQEKKGNFSHLTCLDALEGGPIAVLNLRAFDDSKDKTTVIGLSPNALNAPETVTTPYKTLFNVNSFWAPKAKNMETIIKSQHLLQFGSVGTWDISIFVVKAKPSNIVTLTGEGDNTLDTTKLEIDEYPGLNFDSYLRDTFVDVILFNNSFGPTSNTNKYYGHLFDADGNTSIDSIEELKSIYEAGYVQTFTGSLIPGLVSETGDALSIDTIINSYYAETGLTANINEDILELALDNLINFNLVDYYDFSALTPADFGSAKFIDAKTPKSYMLSHLAPEKLTTEMIDSPADADTKVLTANLLACKVIDDTDLEQNQAKTYFEYGIRIDDYVLNNDGEPIRVQSMEQLDPDADGTPVIITVDGNIRKSDGYIIKWNNPINYGTVAPQNLTSYKPRPEQYIDGTASRQNEILDMINDPGIVKGMRGLTGLRYIVDPFKSYVESGYKQQLGNLMESLDSANRFVRAISSEPFIEDLQKSTNPLFKQFPTSSFDMSYLPDGGNKNFSTKLLTKLVAGADKVFFFGPGDVVRGITKTITGKISNLFYAKTYQYDVVANETGYLSGITELEYPIDDVEREYTEKFRYNAIINFNGGNTIYSNFTAQKEKTAQQQIQNSELLAYIKQSLFDLSKSEAFKKGNYDDYLRTETQCANFMEALVLSGAIDANPVVICNASNNTLEIRKQRIKLVHIEYTPVDVLDKVVFDLQIN